MAHKQEIKQSEARILIYLEGSDRKLHFVRQISTKLDTDYGYMIKILMSMKEKGWIGSEKSAAHPSRTYYHLTKQGEWKLIVAKNLVAEYVKEGDDKDGNGKNSTEAPKD